MTLKKLCKCGRIIDFNQKRCEVCRKEQEQYKKQYNKLYDTYCRDKQCAEFYNSPEWEKLRSFVLAKYKGLDLYAFFIEKKIVYADTVHHIEELKENWKRRFDIDNLLPVSTENHNRIHKLYLKNKKRTQQLLFELLRRWEQEYGATKG